MDQVQETIGVFQTVINKNDIQNITLIKAIVNQKNVLGRVVDGIATYSSNIDALKGIIGLTDISLVTCNTVNKSIYQNTYFIYIPEEILDNGTSSMVSININDKRNPEYEDIEFNYILEIPMNKGTLFIKKYLTGVTLI